MANPTPLQIDEQIAQPKSGDNFFRATFLICSATVLRSVGDRSWDFVLPVLLSRLEPDSLAPTAVLGAVQALAVVFLAPAVAQRLDSDDKRAVFLRMVTIENLAVVLGGASIASIPLDAGGLLVKPQYWAGVLLLGVDALVSSTLGVVVEKDMVAQVCGTCDKRLRVANAWVMRCDLGSSILANLVIGQLMPRVSPTALLGIIGIWHLTVATAMRAVVKALFAAVPGLSQRNERASSQGQPSMGFARGINAFGQLPSSARRAMAALICLYLTVLSPGALLVAWLSSQGVAVGTIATFRSAAQLVGCLAAVLTPLAISRQGASRMGRASLWLQACCIACGMYSVLVGTSGGGPFSLMLAVTVSRLGLWGFDLSERQVVQHAASSVGMTAEDRVVLLNCEKACCDGMSLVMRLCALLFPHPAQFSILVFISVGAVFTATSLVSTASLA